MNKMRSLLTMIVLGAAQLLAGADPAAAEWVPDPADKKQVKAGELLGRMREKIPALEPYFEQSWGYAVIPGITRVAIGFGGAYGSGVVVEQDVTVGRTNYSQFSSGIQLGAKYFSLVIFFKDQQAIEDYKQSKVQFVGQAGIDLATVGVSGTPSYNDGVALFAMTRLGLMGEFSYSGVWFKYKPLDAE